MEGYVVEIGNIHGWSRVNRYKEGVRTFVGFSILDENRGFICVHILDLLQFRISKQTHTPKGMKKKIMDII